MYVDDHSCGFEERWRLTACDSGDMIRCWTTEYYMRIWGADLQLVHTVHYSVHMYSVLRTKQTKCT